MAGQSEHKFYDLLINLRVNLYDSRRNENNLRPTICYFVISIPYYAQEVKEGILQNLHFDLTNRRLDGKTRMECVGWDRCSKESLKGFVESSNKDDIDNLYMLMLYQHTAQRYLVGRRSNTPGEFMILNQSQLKFYVIMQEIKVCLAENGSYIIEEHRNLEYKIIQNNIISYITKEHISRSLPRTGVSPFPDNFSHIELIIK